MTPPTTKLVAMAEKHVRVMEKQLGEMDTIAKHFEKDAASSSIADTTATLLRQFERRLSEILELVRTLKSREAVVVERKRLEMLKSLVYSIADSDAPYRNEALKIIRGWLTSDSPKEKANAENPVSRSDR